MVCRKSKNRKNAIKARAAAGSQLLFEPAGDVRKDLGFVRLHQQLVAGTGIELRLDVPDADVPEALDGPPDSGGALAYRVGITGEEEQGQILGHSGQNGGVV